MHRCYRYYNNNDLRAQQIWIEEREVEIVQQILIDHNQVVMTAWSYQIREATSPMYKQYDIVFLNLYVYIVLMTTITIYQRYTCTIMHQGIIDPKGEEGM